MLRITDHFPNINATEIPRNTKIVVKFNKGLIPKSVSYSSFTVQEADTFTTIVGTTVVKYNKDPANPLGPGIPNIIEFTPTINLPGNRKIKVWLFGKPDSVISSDNEALDNNYSFEFFTNNVISSNNITGDSSVTPVMTSANYDTNTYSLLLNYNTNIYNLNTNLSGVKLFSVNTNYPNSVNIPIPLSGYIDANKLILNLSGVYQQIEAIPHKDVTFNIITPSGLVYDYSLFYHSENQTLYGVELNGESSDAIIPESTEDLMIVSTSPENLGTNTKNLKSVSIKFNQAINYNSASIYDYIKVTSKNVLE